MWSDLKTIIFSMFQLNKQTKTIILTNVMKEKESTNIFYIKLAPILYGPERFTLVKLIYQNLGGKSLWSRLKTNYPFYHQNKGNIQLIQSSLFHRLTSRIQLNYSDLSTLVYFQQQLVLSISMLLRTLKGESICTILSLEQNW